ncbi:MAG: DUF2130 domain-containing protein [Planctomycetota bacterium]|nr:DUF2130 domain-containing protein [Planctomycetota bacterium]
MPDQVIVCPYCKKAIPLTEAIAHQIRERLREEYDAKARQKDEEIATKEQALNAQAEAVEHAKKDLENQVKQRLQQERGKLLKDAQAQVRDETALVVKDLRAQIEEKSRSLQNAQNAELELRKQQRALEEKQQALELEMVRKLDAERQAIEARARERADEAHNLKEQETEKKISDMTKQLEDMKRKLEQGSQQLQGEVAELELERILGDAFPDDQIEPVPKGVKGADVLQKVCNRAGQCCGTIIWECKRTKAWSDGWIAKLKEDQREIKAEIAALMSLALPRDVRTFGLVNGVWVTDYACVTGLAMALRTTLIQVAGARAAVAGTQDMKERLYDYLSGPQFKQRVEALVESFRHMNDDLLREKADSERRWAKRQKQIEQVVKNTLGMYGDMQGIVSLPQLKSLDMKQLEARPEAEAGE